MSSLDLSQLRHEINTELASFTAGRRSELAKIGEELTPVAIALDEFINDGGKRFRPLFAYLGYLAGGNPPKLEALRACTSLELVHVCALIHDDVMDGSDTRRSKPAIHRRFEKYHFENKLRGNAEKFGHSAAILLGDLALVWSDRLLSESGISQSEYLNSQKIFNEMRDELMAGQYLDVLEGALATTSVERSLKVARYKSGKYSIERPLHFGAALAGNNQLFETFSRYGLPLGEAFQLRDDVLGVFGDPKVTGKPAGDDLREGKRTVLIAMAMEGLSPANQEILDSGLCNQQVTENQIRQMQSLITDSGALERVEKLITELTDEAISALQTPAIDTKIAAALEKMAIIATQRSL